MVRIQYVSHYICTSFHLRQLLALAVRDAWGSDEYHPVSHTGSNLTSSGGIGYMIIDALDTMHIMGLTSEYEHARLWIADSLSFDRPGLVNAFEVTIRVLGGLLSTYYLSHDPSFWTRPSTSPIASCQSLGHPLRHTRQLHRFEGKSRPGR
jgi:hypothetical protein